jgi:hypothetical protein
VKIPKQRYRCPLAKVLPEQLDVEAVKRQGWREQRILMVAESDERLDYFQREFVRQIGDKLYGKGQSHA